MSVSKVFLMCVVSLSIVESGGEHLTDAVQPQAVQTPKRFYKNHELPVHQRHQPRSRSRLRRSQQLPSQAEIVLNNLVQQVNELSARVDSQSNQIQDLSREKNDLQQLVSRLNNENTYLTSNLTNILAVLFQHGNDIQTFTDQLTNIQREISVNSFQQNQSVSQLGQKVEGLEDVLNKVQIAQRLANNSLKDQSSELNQLSWRLALAENKVTVQESMTHSLTDWRSNVTADVNTITMTQARLEGEVHDLELRGDQASSASGKLENEILQLRHRLDSNNQRVAFYAQLSQNTQRPPPPSHATIILDEIVTNEGKAYNNATGIFTVPVTGDYSLSITVKPDQSSQLSPHVEIVLDDEVFYMTAPNRPSFQAVLRLEMGQRVWLQTFFTSFYGRGMYFSGALLNPEMP